MPVNCTNSCLNKVGHNFSCQSKVWKEFYRSFKKSFLLVKKRSATSSSSYLWCHFENVIQGPSRAKHRRQQQLQCGLGGRLVKDAAHVAFASSSNSASTAKADDATTAFIFKRKSQTKISSLSLFLSFYPLWKGKQPVTSQIFISLWILGKDTVYFCTLTNFTYLYLGI